MTFFNILEPLFAPQEELNALNDAVLLETAHDPHLGNPA